MANEQELATAKLWCDQARSLLKAAKFSKRGQKDIQQRVAKILAELKALDKGVQSGKFGLDGDAVADYVDRFLGLAGALNAAARTGDLVEAERQSLRLSELKKELAVHLATSRGGKKKAQDKVDVRAGDNVEINAYVEARDAAILRVTGLRMHAGSEAIEADLDQIETSLLQPARGKADQDDYPAAMALLLRVGPACDVAERIADDCAACMADIERVQAMVVEWRKHEQAVVAGAEFEQADAKLRAALAAAAVKERKYPQARTLATEAQEIGTAGHALAEQSKASIAARLTAVAALTTLNDHAQAPALLPEREALGLRLDQADALTATDVRRYGDAATAFTGIAEAARSAKDLADRCQAWATEQLRVQTRIDTLAKHAQAAAGAAELKLAREKLATTAAMVAPGRRDYPAALGAVKEAADLADKAATFSANCQTAVDARAAASGPLLSLATLRKRFDSVRTQLEVLEPLFADAGAKTALDVRDYAGATALYKKVEQGAINAQAVADSATWDQSLERAARHLLDALQANTPERTRLEALWALAHEQAEAGQHGKALKLLEQVRTLATEALKTQPTPSSGKSVEERSGELDTDAKLSTALLDVQAFVGSELKAAVELGTAFGLTAPAAWKNETDRIAGTLTLERDAGLPAVETALAQARKDLVTHETAVRKLMAERDAWLERWEVYDGLRATLAVHLGIVGTQVLVDLLDAAVVAAGLCQTTANGLNFDGAKTALELQITALTQLAVKADASSNFKALRTRRQNELNATPAGAHASATTERLAAVKCLADADIAAGLGDFVKAMAELDKMPEHMEKVPRINKAAADYPWYENKWLPSPADTWGANPTYARLIAPELDHFRALMAGAKSLKDQGDIFAATTLISGVGTRKAEGGYKIGATTEGLYEAVVDYVGKRGTFGRLLSQLEKHKGREGVDSFYVRAKAERDFANASANKREFVAATQILDKVIPLFPTYVTVADRYVTYAAKKKDTKQKIDAIRTQDKAGVATAELAGADRYLALADQQQLAAAAQAAVAPLEAADKALDAALAEANAGKVVIEKMQALQDMKPAAAGTDAETQQARVNAIPGMKAHVRSLAGDGTFDTLLNGSDAPLQQAITALGLTPADTGAASTALDQAERILTEALQKVLRKPAYDTALATVNTEHTATLPGLNLAPNRCLDGEITRIGELLTQAKDLAKAPGLDFAQALPKLTEASVLAGRAKEKRAVFASLVADRQIIKNLATHLDGTTFQPALLRERDRVRKIDTDIDVQLAAFNFAAARKLVADGKALKAPYEKLCVDYTAISTKRTDGYRLTTALLVGKPNLKLENDEFQLLKPKIDKMIDVDHAFEAAKKLLVRVGYLRYFAGVEGPDYKKYTDARLLQANILTPLKPGNAGVKDLIDTIDATLVRADAMALRREYIQAQNELKTLTPLLTEVARDAPLYAAWIVARDAANTKYDEADKHAQAPLIRPLLTVADAERTQAGEMATRRDFAGAAKLADAITATCTSALLTANSHTGFEALGGGADAANVLVLQQALETLRAKLATLTDSNVPVAEQLPGQVGLARQKIEAADAALKGGDTGTAATAIKDGSTACGQAEVHKLQFVQIRQQITAALKLVDDFTGGSQTAAAKAYVAKRMAATRLTIDGALQQMISRGATAATAVLTQATATVRADILLAEQRAAYDLERLKLVPASGASELAKLEGHAHRYAAAKDIETLRTELDAAEVNADIDKPDFAKAMAALKKAGQAAAAGRLALAMLDSATPPTAADIASVLDQSGGDKKIDEMVARLDPKQRRAVMQQVFSVRFGCKIDIYKAAALDTTDTKLGADVMRFYKNMALLPPKHVLKNDNLLVLEDRLNATGTGGEGGSSDFAGWFRKLTMRDGNSATSAGRDLGAAHALGDDVPEECKPANDDPVLFFDWNTLHEAGHAVEDKYRFMKQHEGEAAFGGWTEYAQDTGSVAVKLVAEFQYDLTYTQDLLAGLADPALPDPPSGVTVEAWEQRRVRLKLWVDNARNGKSPWETDATAQALKLKTGEIIHEAYPDHWCGYLASERSKGITGYQFRAPLEWFSEMYAAYYSKKLKPGHPATSWLATLETADKT